MGAAPNGRPGCPLLAFWTASTDKNRRVFTQSRSSSSGFDGCGAVAIGLAFPWAMNTPSSHDGGYPDVGHDFSRKLASGKMAGQLTRLTLGATLDAQELPCPPEDRGHGFVCLFGHCLIRHKVALGELAALEALMRNTNSVAGAPLPALLGAAVFPLRYPLAVIQCHELPGPKMDERFSIRPPFFARLPRRPIRQGEHAEL